MAEKYDGLRTGRFIKELCGSYEEVGGFSDVISDAG